MNFINNNTNTKTKCYQNKKIKTSQKSKQKITKTTKLNNSSSSSSSFSFLNNNNNNNNNNSTSSSSISFSSFLNNNNNKNNQHLLQNFSSNRPVPQILSITQCWRSRNAVLTNRITLDDIANHFERPLWEAAEQLSISPTTLKKLCRFYGLKRWPYRWMKKIEKRKEQLKKAGLKSRSDALRQWQISLQLHQLENFKWKHLNQLSFEVEDRGEIDFNASSIYFDEGNELELELNDECNENETSDIHYSKITSKTNPTKIMEQIELKEKQSNNNSLETKGKVEYVLDLPVKT